MAKRSITFDDVKTVYNTWLYKPNFRILKTVLAQYCSHFALNEPPVWSFVLGESSSGKSEQIIEPVLNLPLTKPLDTFTEHCFLSDMNKGSGELLSLKDAGNGFKHGIIIFPDFSTFLALKTESRAKLQSDMRAMYSSSLKRSTGSGNKPVEWKGKVTFIAACTPGIERYWSMNRDLGERFIYLRMDRMTDEDKLQASAIARRNVGRYHVMKKELRSIIYEYVHPESLESINEMPQGILANEHIDTLSLMIEKLRVSVQRDYAGRIQKVEECSGPARLTKIMASLIRGNMCLERRDNVIDRDFRMVLWAMLDCIPLERWKIINLLWESEEGKIDYHEGAKALQMSVSYFTQIAEEMLMMGVCEKEKVMRRAILVLKTESLIALHHLSRGNV